MIYFFNYFFNYFFIADFVKNFLLKDNIDLWNEMKNSLFYFTIFTSIQTLLFIYYITKMDPKEPNDELPDLTLEEVETVPNKRVKQEEVETVLKEELPEQIKELTPLEIDNILDSLNNLEQRLNIIRTNFEDN
jgi:hypothetical protein